ncbi:hypothetical protein [Streptomyces sp. NPDC006925]|uniref:hypothetical protein n=1 Tax=Streptomyces sp. NPDC006925 TaxID=3364768 RepID=UPI0036B76390
MSPPEWSPVVFARLHRVDEWWRALPHGTRGSGPLAHAVAAAVANGRELRQGPRLLLAYESIRPGEPLSALVGAACQAALLDPDHSTDSAGRPLYCFVGWLSQTARPGAAPSFESLRAGFEGWASTEYARAVRPDWDALVSPPWRGHSTPGPPPWPAEDETGDALDSAVLPRPEAGRRWLLPEDRAAAYWTAARSVSTPFLLIAGWRTDSPAPSAATHLCTTAVTAPVLTGGRNRSGSAAAPSSGAARPGGPAAERWSSSSSGPSTGPSAGRRSDGLGAPVPHGSNNSSGGCLGWVASLLRGLVPGTAPRPSAGRPQPRLRPARRLAPRKDVLPGREIASRDALTGGDLFAELDKAPEDRRENQRKKQPENRRETPQQKQPEEPPGTGAQECGPRGAAPAPPRSGPARGSEEET